MPRLAHSSSMGTSRALLIHSSVAVSNILVPDGSGGTGAYAPCHSSSFCLLRLWLAAYRNLVPVLLVPDYVALGGVPRGDCGIVSLPSRFRDGVIAAVRYDELLQAGWARGGHVASAFGLKTELSRPRAGRSGRGLPAGYARCAVRLSECAVAVVF